MVCLPVSLLEREEKEETYCGGVTAVECEPELDKERSSVLVDGVLNKARVTDVRVASMHC